MTADQQYILLQWPEANRFHAEMVLLDIERLLRLSMSRQDRRRVQAIRRRAEELAREAAKAQSP